MHNLKRAFRITICIFALIGQYAAAGPAHTAATPQADLVDHIVVTKSTHTMVLLSHGKVLRTYKVALGSEGGKKAHQGDHKTPEGSYTIDSKNKQSRFHLALHVSYPNAGDLRQAHAAHLPAGGDIMIHGLPDNYSWMGPTQHLYDWTDGCVAVSNAEIEEVWKLVPVGTAVEIKP